MATTEPAATLRQHPSAPPRVASRLAARLVSVALACSVLGQWWFLWRLPLVEQVRHVPDDSFFYLRLAQQFWHALDFTFDGIHPTYGFQPLWQLLLVVLQPFCGGPLSFFHGVLALCALLHGAIGWQLWRLAATALGTAGGVTAALAWGLNPAAMVWCWGLKENALYALLLLVALRGAHTMVTAGEPRRGLALRLGAVLGAIVLTRANAVPVALGILVCTVLAVGCATPLRVRLRGALAALAAAAMLAAPWYLFAWGHFGTALPTSGTWKMFIVRGQVELGWGVPWLGAGHFARAFSEWPANLELLFAREFGWVRGLVCALAVLWVLSLLFVGRAAARLPAAGWWLVTSVLVLALGASFADQLLLPSYLDYADWYAVAPFVGMPLLVGLLGSPLGRTLVRVPTALVAVAVLVGCVLLVPGERSLHHFRIERGLLEQPPRQMQLLEMGLWAGRHLPADARIGIWDPGIVSYFSQRDLTSLDPLMNSLDYQRIEVIGDPVRYVRENRISYLMGVVHRVGEEWQYDPMPKGSFDILWMPHPGHDLGWVDPAGKKVHYAIVRPRDTEGPAFLGEDDFPCGLLHPNDPQQRRWVTRDRDALLRGIVLDADVLRVQVDGEHAGGAVELVTVDGAVLHTLAPDRGGWHWIDVRAHRGKQVMLRVPTGADPARALPQAQFVDYRFPPGG